MWGGLKAEENQSRQERNLGVRRREKAGRKRKVCERKERKKKNLFCNVIK